MSREIELLSCPLSGVNLIEANAGTGKTYTITALTARMICEAGLHIDEILVVTFTKAAVSDLKAKIYERLTGLKKALEESSAGEITTDDGFIRDYAQKIDKKTALDRIRNAVRDFDTASIFTIHSFCQRMLTENSFSGRIAYDTEMTGDAAEILIYPVRDFWRKKICSLPAEAAELFAGESPEKLTSFLLKIENNPSVKIINCPTADLSELVSKRKALTEAFGKVKSFGDRDYENVLSIIFPQDGSRPLNGKVFRADYVRGAIKKIKEKILLGNVRFDFKSKSVGNLTPSVIKENNKSGKDIEHPFFTAMDNWKNTYEEFRRYSGDFYNFMLLELKEYTDAVLDTHRMKLNSQSYGDLITRMHSAVTKDKSRMALHIQNKFKAVLIDEFQDTDPMQYDIFMDSFGKYGKPVFMIGDPKQAIYSFRGADVYTYIRAASGQDPFTLTRNYRSDKDLVAAVNGVFSKEDAFLIDKIGYNDSYGELDIKVSYDGSRVGPLTVWKAQDADRKSLAQACASEISKLLNGRAVIKDKNGERRVRPSDFAVLTRTRDQAIDVKNALSGCRVPCVISGSENVFASDQAKDMARLLAAAVSPYSEKAVRTALVTDIFGYTALKLHSLTETDGWEDIFALFLELSETFRRAGAAPMFFRAAGIAGLYERLAGRPQGERRLTNLIHIAELLQKHEAEKKASPAQLLIWLTQQISLAGKRQEEYELKMDSDDNAVTITTIHKSKGLEYNIVFTPFIMLSKNSGHKDFDFASFHDDNDELVMDMSGDAESTKKQNSENMAEDLRLIYVALTRAKALCYTAWGTARTARQQSEAMIYLIHGKNAQYDNEKSDGFFKKIESVVLDDMPLNQPQIYVRDVEGEIEPNRTFSGNIPAPRRINSFSGLIHSASTARDTDQFTVAADEAEQTDSIFSFPKGAKAGSCLHECMELIPLDDFTPDSVRRTVEGKLDEYFFGREFTDAVTENLLSILTRELIPGIKLQGIPKDSHVHEMEFHISTGAYTSAALADIFNRHGLTDLGRACSALDFSAEEGFLTGFSDLVFFTGGKYYIIDWKSNHLGGHQTDYSQQNMHAEMIRSHYYLQLYFYTLALHMHLEKCLPGYDYDTHMGGGIYVFMRGVGRTGGEGIYFHRPDKDVILEMKEAAADERHS